MDIASLPPAFQDEWASHLNFHLKHKHGVGLVESTEVVEFGIAIVKDLVNEVNHAVVVNKNGAHIWDPNPNLPIYGETLMTLVLV
ncbi:hypothetical protein N9878_00405 [bacterium]|nr:hypothetical protein [bacterium]